MTYASPSLFSRTGSLLLSAGIHAAIGLALISRMMAGAPDASKKAGERGDVLVVKLLPLPHGGMAGPGQHQARPEEVPTGATLPLAGKATGRTSAGSPQPSGALSAGDDGRGDSSGAQGGTERTTGAPAPSGAEIQAFRTTLLRHIERFQTYPASARAAGEQGLTRVRFVMDRAGHVTDVWIETSSGFTRLDAEAQAAIRRAQPLPAPPSNWPRSFEVALPMAFSLG